MLKSVTIKKHRAAKRILSLNFFLSLEKEIIRLDVEITG